MGGTMDATESFVGYLTKKSLFFPDIATSPGPLSSFEKFELAANESISPSTIVHASLVAGIGQARDVPAAYGQGAEGFANRFGADMGRNASNAFFGDFVFASLFKQDPRFFPQSNPSLWGSIKYAARRVVIVRTDAGNSTFNSSGILGLVAGESLANAYLPVSQQGVGQTAQRVGTDIAFQFAGNIFKNYWPKLFRDLGLNRLKVVPAPATDTPVTNGN